MEETPKPNLPSVREALTPKPISGLHLSGLNDLLKSILAPKNNEADPLREPPKPKGLAIKPGMLRLIVPFKAIAASPSGSTRS